MNLKDTKNFNKLQWACRRGMLELDILLNRFLNEVYLQLPPNEQAYFVEVLSCQDPELFAWIMGKSAPNEPHIAYITERIRRHAQCRAQA